MTQLKNFAAFLTSIIWLWAHYYRIILVVYLACCIVYILFAIDNVAILEMALRVVLGLLSVGSFYVVCGFGNATFHLLFSRALRAELRVPTFVASEAARRYFLSSRRLR